MKRALVLLAMTGLSLTDNLSSAAEPFGRFFFTPAQRAQLDTARTQKSRAAPSGEKPEETAPAPGILTYGGAVRRNDGKSTVWINNQAIHDREAAGGVVIDRVRPNGTLTLQVPQTDRGVELKVGQSLEIVSGTIEEAYARHATAPRPAPKPASADAANPEAKSAEEKTLRAPANTTSTGKSAGRDPWESRTGGVPERLRSLRKDQDDDGQDRP
ncbi:MAG: hypothetical protein K2Y16_02030 [Burkholderiales bacterium]|nr:hypothetical protein [Burkholderiales bacterium]